MLGLVDFYFNIIGPYGIFVLQSVEIQFLSVDFPFFAMSMFSYMQSC